MSNYHDWQQRVVEEQKELKEKIDKLTDFITSRKSGTLPFFDEKLLLTQRWFMIQYNITLLERIARFEP